MLTFLSLKDQKIMPPLIYSFNHIPYALQEEQNISTKGKYQSYFNTKQTPHRRFVLGQNCCGRGCCLFSS
jgi:hypothetical protein